MCAGSYVSDDELQKALEKKSEKTTSEKQRWMQRMLRSAKHHHKICPYYDKKTGMCFIALGEKCDRDGRYDNCPRFLKFLEEKYEYYKSRNLPLPVDFADIVIAPF